MARVEKKHVVAIFVNRLGHGAQDFFCEEWPLSGVEYEQMAESLTAQTGETTVITNFIELRDE